MIIEVKGEFDMFEGVANINWNDTNQVLAFSLNLAVIVIVYILLFYLFFSIIKRSLSYIFLTVSFVLIVTSFLLGLLPAFILVAMLSTIGIFISIFSNFGSFKVFLANPFKRVTFKTPNKGHVGKVYDRQKLYDVITQTVSTLSKSKIGAIITFERSYSLTSVSKNGVTIDCPVNSELLMTIFYPGTRLHDGAVIIHEETIVAASVFFTPSTKAYAGKYGSRHRAAIGISEISDSVTVVVSEETGRISIAFNGQIETVSGENFRRVFENYMADSTTKED